MRASVDDSVKYYQPTLAVGFSILRTIVLIFLHVFGRSMQISVMSVLY